MKKYLLLAGVFTVCATTSAHADGWYYEDNGYSQPTYQEQGYYRAEPRYVRQNQGDYQPAAPRYRQISPAEARNYRERQYTRSSSANTYTTSEDTNQIRPYIGVDVAMSSMDYENIDDGYNEDYGDYMEDSHNSLSLVVGAKFNKYVGIEAFIQQSGEEDKNYEGGKTTSDYNAIGVDLIGYMPVNQELELLASLGLAQYNFHVTEEYEDSYYEYKEKDSLNTTGIRLGIGAQYNLTEHVALRGMARYVKLNDDDIIKNMVELSLGLRYMF